jgi:hypothetical protein
MAKPLPTDFYEGISVATVATVESLVIPMSSLEGLTDAAANPTTGDGRAVFKALLDTAYTALIAMPLNSRPANLSIELEDERLSSNSPIHTLQYKVNMTTTSSPVTYQMADEPV